jgi:RNA polymerase sigma factor (sigma-70 family)
MRVARSTEEIEDLAARMAVAEVEAYSEFAVTFGPRLRAFFLRKGVAAGEAEELSVSCITDIALKIDKYKPLRPGGFEAWVFTLARHSLTDWWRSHRGTVPLSDDLTAPAFDDDQGIEPNFIIAVAVREAIAQLAVSDQLLIRMRHLESESTYAEIGDRLNISPEAARVRHFRAMKRLKTILEADERISPFIGLREP